MNSPSPSSVFSAASVPQLRVAVVIASTGRPESLAAALHHYSSQTYAPSRIVFSVASERDLPDSPEFNHRAECLIGRKGLPTQRNTALRHIGEAADIIAFFDDDYIPSRGCIAQIARFFQQYPDVAGADGRLLEDGINGAGIDLETAVRLVNEYDAAPSDTLDILGDRPGLYGCNMAYRNAAIQGLWFDERLKLYGWQEDVDFAAQVARRGRIVSTNAFVGVHQGVKTGRTSGLRLGYSQIVNPAYLHRKGTMSARFALNLMLRNLLANHAKAFFAEPWVDRRGRAKGNWLGLWDIARGRLTPERIETL